jgi:hypothetical protein
MDASVWGSQDSGGRMEAVFRMAALKALSGKYATTAQFKYQGRQLLIQLFGSQGRIVTVQATLVMAFTVR